MASAVPSTLDQEGDTTLKASLGGLLHDVGKLWAQAGGRQAQDARFECEHPTSHRSFESCPSCRKRYRYAHSPLGANLIADSLPKLAFLQQLAVGHHSTGDEAALGGDILRYVTLGDHLSAGERDERHDEDSGPPAPLLVNPFARDEALREYPAHLAGAKLRGIAEGDHKVAYADLVASAREAFKIAADYAAEDLGVLPEYLLGAVEGTCSLVPSAFQRDVADISLAAHLQLAGAFAGALAAGNVEADPSETDELATIVAGDVSGIQAFIHRTASKGAARSMRARSFYLVILSLVVARYLARELRVSPLNVLSVSGGNFLVLAPRQSGELLHKIGTTIDNALQVVHGSRLSVVLASLPLSLASTQRFPEVMRELRTLVGEHKSRRYEETALELGIFEPRGDGGPLRACRSCGDDATGGLDDAAGRICPLCHSLESVGRRLPNSQYLTVRETSNGEAEGWQEVASRLGFQIELHARSPQAPFAGAIYALDRSGLADLPVSRLLATGRHVPKDRDRILEFSEIAASSRGRPLLAVLKADVDDLGDILSSHFARGGQDINSPSRLNTFSRFLSLFFEGRLAEIATEPRFNSIYMVFAGGDDLLAIGAWDQVIEFALEMTREFSDWTAGNPVFHLSAGIAIGDSSRPVMAGLREAEDGLDRAKQVPGKNCVTLLDHVISWDDLREVAEWRDHLTGMVETTADGGAIARSLLRRLMGLETLVGPDPTRVQYGPELWRLYYGLRRLAQRQKAHAQDLDGIYEQALQPRGALKLAMAARLAEFATTRAGHERSVSSA